jgi:hypothetical protein
VTAPPAAAPAPHPPHLGPLLERLRLRMETFQHRLTGGGEDAFTKGALLGLGLAWKDARDLVPAPSPAPTPVPVAEAAAAPPPAPPVGESVDITRVGIAPDTGETSRARSAAAVATPPPVPAAQRKAHWTQRETPEARAARMAKIAATARAKAAPASPAAAPPPQAPWPAEVAEDPSLAATAQQAALPAAAEAARADAAVLSRHERARALILAGKDEHIVSAEVGLPLREVYRLRGELRDDGLLPA